MQFSRLRLNFSSLCYFFSFCGELLMGFLVFSSVPLDHLFAKRVCRSDQYSPCCKKPGHDKTAKLNCAFSEYSDQLCISSTLIGSKSIRRSVKTPDKLDTQADLSSLIRTFVVCTAYFVRFYVSALTNKRSRTKMRKNS